MCNKLTKLSVTMWYTFFGIFDDTSLWILPKTHDPSLCDTPDELCVKLILGKCHLLPVDEVLGFYKRFTIKEHFVYQLAQEGNISLVIQDCWRIKGSDVALMQPRLRFWKVPKFTLHRFWERARSSIDSTGMMYDVYIVFVYLRNLYFVLKLYNTCIYNIFINFSHCILQVNCCLLKIPVIERACAAPFTCAVLNVMNDSLSKHRHH